MKTYNVQIDSFTRRSDAEEFLDEVNSKGLNARLYGEHGAYRILIGGFIGESAAREILDEVKRLGYRNAFIICID